MSRSAYVARVETQGLRTLRALRGVLSGRRSQNGTEHADKDGPSPIRSMNFRTAQNGDRRNGMRISGIRTGSIAMIRNGLHVRPPVRRIAVQGYLKNGRTESTGRAGADQKENPFPQSAGMCYNRRCEDACTRETWTRQWPSTKKKFIARQDLEAENRYIPANRSSYEQDGCSKRRSRSSGGPD